MPNSLTSRQQNEIRGAILLGCDRETAAKYAQTTWAELHIAMQADPGFAAQLRHDEAAVEIQHMKQLRLASEKEANWRISIWWLERLYPDRYGPRGAGEINPRQLKKFIEHLAAVLFDEVRNDEDRERLIKCFEVMANTLELFLRDDLPPDESSGSESAGDFTSNDLGLGADHSSSRNGAPRSDNKGYA